MPQLNDFDQPNSAPERKTFPIVNHALAHFKGIILYGIASMLIYFILSY